MESQLRIYFGSALSNLYFIGFLSTDLHRLITFTETIEGDEGSPLRSRTGDAVERWFNYTSRHSPLLEKHARNSKVVRARNGSLELYIAGMSLASSIVVPIAVAIAQSKLGEKGKIIKFEVSHTDKVLDRHIKKYARGDYGKGTDGLNMLFETLSALKYDVSVIADNAYGINRAVNTCSKRIVKTVRHVASI